MLTKGGLLMCILNFFSNFVSDGVKTLHDAALGKYSHESESISEIRAEIFGEELSDSERVRRDWQMMGRDARTAINKYVSAHE